jgi:hypothetical protein
MANQLKVALIESIQSLRAQRWSFRRIARELGIHRETVARYVRLAEAKPAKAPLGSNTSDSDSASEAGVAPTAAEPAKALFGSAVGCSTCEPWREIILAKLDAGLSTQRISIGQSTPVTGTDQLRPSFGTRKSGQRPDIGQSTSRRGMAACDARSA